MLEMLRQMYYGKPWSATAREPLWDFVIPKSPELGNPKPKLGQTLFDALHNTVTIEGTDLGHVFVGLEAMTTPVSSVIIEKSKSLMGVKLGGVKMTVDISNESFATWGGDVGSVAGAYLVWCGIVCPREPALREKEGHQRTTPHRLRGEIVE